MFTLYGSVSVQFTRLNNSLQVQRQTLVSTTSIQNHENVITHLHIAQYFFPVQTTQQFCCLICGLSEGVGASVCYRVVHCVSVHVDAVVNPWHIIPPNCQRWLVQRLPDTTFSRWWTVEHVLPVIVKPWVIIGVTSCLQTHHTAVRYTRCTRRNFLAFVSVRHTSSTAILCRVFPSLVRYPISVGILSTSL